jgi:hypothetical protein
MELFIRIKDGQPFEHPILKDNFIQAFPDIDVNNLPSEFAKFERIEKPILDLYEAFVSEEPTYELVEGIYKDVWHKREMTTEEKTVVQQTVITAFNEREYASNWSTWILDESTCTMQPPILRPDLDQTKIDAGIFTFWCGAENNWKDTPAKPTDDKQYKFDFFAWQWNEVTQ